MEKEKQDIYRDKLIAEYEQKEFEGLANADYWAKRFKAMEVGADEYEKRIKDLEEKIQAILVLPTGQRDTVEARQKIKAMRKDIQDYRSRIDSMKKNLSELEKKATGWHAQSMQFLDLVEHLRTFSVRTPAEIEEFRKKEKEKNQDQSAEPTGLKE